MSQQYERIGKLLGLSDWAHEQYHDPATVAQTGKVECSLVTDVEHATPGESFGHIIEVTGFGKGSLAKLTVDRAFNLTMVGVEADSSGVQPQSIPHVGSNGQTSP